MYDTAFILGSASEYGRRNKSSEAIISYKKPLEPLVLHGLQYWFIRSAPGKKKRNSRKAL
jgi:hypothetical protein